MDRTYICYRPVLELSLACKMSKVKCCQISYCTNQPPIRQKLKKAYALSICSDKIIFVQDKMKIVLDKIIFVQDKKFCPKLKSHFSYNSSLMMNFLSMYKIFCSGQKIFCLRQFWFCPGQKSFCLDRWIGHKSP